MRCHDRHRSARLGALAFFAAMLLVWAAPGEAQVLYGSLVGTVTDTSHAGVPGAAVTIINVKNNLARETQSRSDGSYSFVNVLPGDYNVRVVVSGFKEFQKTAVPVSANTVARVDVPLEVGAVSEVVTVEGTTALLQTDRGDLHAELKSQELSNLPLGNYRNYQSLLNLVPGTTPAGFQNAITDTPARSLTTNVNGTARNNNNTRLDGASNIYIWLPHHAAYVAPTETVDTVNIATASFDAEQGMAGGAAVTVLTKSGTNTFHGSGFLLHEDDGLRARNFFNHGDKPDTKRNIGGATIGGPIIKDKLFFFGGWEGHYSTSPSTKTGTVPTAAMRAGDFSAFGTTIYDPATGNPDGTGRTPFPNNTIPANRMDPIALQLQERLPLPNGSGTSNNYTKTGLVDFTRNNYDFKLNYNISSSAQVFAKYSQMNATVQSDMFLGNPPDGGAGGQGFGAGSGLGDTKVRIGTVGLTWTVSPNLIVDGTFGLTRFDQECTPPDFGTNFGTDVFHIPGTNGDGGANGDIRYSGMPAFRINGFESFGGVDGWTPLFRNDRSYNFSTNATYVANKHELRFGVDVVRLELNHWQPELAYGPRGTFFFYGGATALAPSGSPNAFNSYAQFLLGLDTNGDVGYGATTKSLQAEIQTGREWQYGIYIRDRWQVNNKLTLNLGLRWEKYPLMTRADRGIEYYDNTTNKVLIGGRGGNPEDLGIEVKHPHFLPRIGFSYRMNEDNVFRGGYGMTVSPIPFSRPLRGFYPATVTFAFPGATSYIPFGTLEQGIPLFFAPDLSSGSVDLPPNAGMGSPYADAVHRGYIQSWNLTYERRLPWNMSLATSYVGTLTTHQLGFKDINAAGVGEGQAGQPLRAAFGRTAFTWRFDGWLSANYHALQVALNKPFTKGLFLKAAYTWSKAMNRQDNDGWDNVDWNDDALLGKNYGPAGYDRTHIFQLGFVAELPMGKNGSGPLNAIVKNWSVNGVVSAFTGTPFRVLASGASLNAPGNRQYGDLVGTPDKLGGIGSGNPYYNPSAWAPVTEVRPGNTGRNSVRGPGAWNIDMGLFRRFPLGPRFVLEARAEAFNLTNTPHFRNPEGNVNSAAFMTITATGTSNSANDASERQFRLGLRLQF
jgi:Carboxypeptidase regulatory-like domain/TonB dependent receptor-like, beta-barrel